MKSESATSSRSSAGVIKKKTSLPTFEEFILARDYVGARTLLEVTQKEANDKKDIKTDEWIAFCDFHLGDYQRAMERYENIRKMNTNHKEATINIVVCMFYLGMYDEAQKLIEQVPSNPLKVYF